MHVVGRYEKLRAWTVHSNTLSAPLLLDRGKAHDLACLLPFGGEEWWKSPSGLWRQTKNILCEARGSLRGSQHLSAQGIGFTGDSSVGFANNIVLNSAYVAGSTGAALANSFRLPYALTVNKIYFLIASYTGTAANVNDIEVEIRADSSGSPDTAGAVVSGSMGAVDPASNTSWVSVSGLTASLSAATRYWAIVRDADGGATDFATVRNRTSDAEFSQSIFAQRAYDTSNGWSTKNDRSAPSYIVVVFSDGTAIGLPYSATVAATSGTTQRGLLIGGLTERLKIWGYVGSLTGNGTITGNIWSGSNGPTGTADVATTTTPLMAALGSPVNIGGVEFGGGVTLSKATQYRLVLAASSNSSFFRVHQIGTVGIGSASDLAKAFIGNGTWYYTEESGGTWANDDPAAFPGIRVLIDDQVVGASTGGGPLVGPGNLVG